MCPHGFRFQEYSYDVHLLRGLSLVRVMRARSPAAFIRAKSQDFLSTGRQPVVPPSVHHTGGAYRVTQDNELLPWRGYIQEDQLMTRQRAIANYVALSGTGGSSVDGAVKQLNDIYAKLEAGEKEKLRRKVAQLLLSWEEAPAVKS